MAYALVAQVTGNGIAGFTSSAINTTGANLLVVSASFGVDPPLTISDSKGNTYVELTKTTSGGGAIGCIYYCANPIVGSGHTFTVGGGTSAVAAILTAWSGASAAPYDQQSQTIFAPGTTAPFGATSVTPSEDGCLIIAGQAVENSGFGATFTPGSGWTQVDRLNFVGGTSYGVSQLYRVQTTAAAIAASNTVATWSTAVAGTAMNAVFKPAAADPTPPTLTGSLTVGTVTSNSIQVSWSAGADNVAVTSYETSLDGTSWTDRGNVLTYTFTGLTASTSYTPRVRAKDAAGNVSTPPLQVTQTTGSSGDTTVPVLTGTITASAITQTTYTINWPSGSDNVAVTSYETSLDGGSTWSDAGNVLTRNITGRTAGATDQVRVRAKDAAGNVSTPALSTTVTLLSPSSGTLTSEPLKDMAGNLLASTALTYVDVYSASTGAFVVRKTGVSTNGSGVFSVSDVLIVAGTNYKLDWETSTGKFRMPRKVAA